MSAADVIIRAVDVTKVYRLYANPSFRFRDMFGLLGNRPGAYTEHAALDRVNLEIRRGEKVAIIGRNGAGKSTFLKLVTNVVQPTSGTLTVDGAVHALLQIGTGFHPDFTGRENVFAYFAQLGITGASAERQCAEVIEFAELEEYIDQPVKTYSTGMAVRLMFSASTAIKPDLLVLDEVLGVGDAYFAQKSFARMRELCDTHGATLLLVTHDIYSAVRMCNRVVWFDRGSIMMDGDAEAVVKAYEDSIRLQEERRLRLKKQTQLAAAPAVEAPRRDVAHLLVEIQSRDGRPQPSPVHFGRISLVSGDRAVAELPLGEDAFDRAGTSHLVKEGGCWGDVVEWQGRKSRPMLNYGSSFHKVVGVLAVPPDILATDNLRLTVDYGSDEPCRLRVLCYLGDRVADLGELPHKTGGWITHAAGYVPGRREATAHPSLRGAPAGVQGAGDVVIAGFAMLNGAGDEVHTVAHGESVRFRIEYRVLRKNLREAAQVFIVISRNNAERVCKFMMPSLMLDEARAPSGVIEMHVPKMMLGGGTYSVAVEIAAEGYVERGMSKFFSVDPDVYHCLTHAMEFTVTNSGWIGDGTIFEGEGEWSMCERPR